jgi:hypothetical protein
MATVCDTPMGVSQTGYTGQLHASVHSALLAATAAAARTVVQLYRYDYAALLAIFR